MHEADECRLGLITFLKSVRFFIIFLEIGHSAIPARSACLLNEWQQTGRHRPHPSHSCGCDGCPKADIVRQTAIGQILEKVTLPQT